MSVLARTSDSSQTSSEVRKVPTGDIGSHREMKVTPPTDAALLQRLRQNILCPDSHKFFPAFIRDNHALQRQARCVLDLVGQEFSDGSSCRRLGSFQAG